MPSDGLTDQFDALGPARRLHLPMRPGNRSLNLANAVAVVVFEAWRQLDFAGAVTPVDRLGSGLTSETLTSGPFDH